MALHRSWERTEEAPVYGGMCKAAFQVWWHCTCLILCDIWMPRLLLMYLEGGVEYTGLFPDPSIPICTHTHILNKIQIKEKAAECLVPFLAMRTGTGSNSPNVASKDLFSKVTAAVTYSRFNSELWWKSNEWIQWHHTQTHHRWQTSIWRLLSGRFWFESVNIDFQSTGPTACNVGMCWLVYKLQQKVSPQKSDLGLPYPLVDINSKLIVFVFIVCVCFLAQISL